MKPHRDAGRGGAGAGGTRDAGAGHGGVDAVCGVLIVSSRIVVFFFMIRRPTEIYHLSFTAALPMSTEK